jgi:hypothetical protein
MGSSIVVFAGLALGLGCLFGAFTVLRRRRLIADLPTSKTQGVFIGQAELKGTAESETPLTSFMGGERCVLYQWQVEEHWSRTVHETYRDAQGHTQTRMRVESGWTQVAAGKELPPFYLKDDTGVIRILPEGANIHGRTTFDKTVGRGDELYYGKGPERSVPNSNHRRRFKETAIPLHATLYITGQARERQDVVAAEIAADKKCPLFIISMRSEKQISGSYMAWFWFWLVLGAALALGGVGLQAAFGLPLAWQSFAVMGGIYLAVFGLGWVWTAYNRLITLGNRVRQGWSQIDVQLKRRHDLIPNLVQAVEGYAHHEADVQALLAGLRQQFSASGVDSQALAARLIAVRENYPELKASASFLKLQQELSATEQRIALARGYYNEITTFYNTRLEIYPDRLVGMLAGLKPRPLFLAADFERAPVEVHLADHEAEST